MLWFFARHIAERLAQALRQLTDDYRPERHYMRGPGPKWRERHEGAE